MGWIENAEFIIKHRYWGLARKDDTWRGIPWALMIRQWSCGMHVQMVQVG